MHLCHQAVQFGTGQRAVMLCGLEGNRRSGVALAMLSVITKAACMYMVVAMKALSTVRVVLAATVSLYIY